MKSRGEYWTITLRASSDGDTRLKRTNEDMKNVIEVDLGLQIIDKKEIGCAVFTRENLCHGNQYLDKMRPNRQYKVLSK